MDSNYYRKIVSLVFFFIVLISTPFLQMIQADEGPESNWEERLNALEMRVMSLEEENKQLKTQLESKVGTPVAASENVTNLEDRLVKIEKGIAQRVQFGQGALKISGLLQAWYTNDQSGHNRFRIRRGEIKLSGKISDEQPIEYAVMIDPAQVTEDASRKSVLQDVFITLGYIPHHTVDIGQYKVGIGEEGSRSSTKIDTIERAYISRTFGDQRDIGIRLSGKWPFVDYNIGVFNGSGMNQADANDQKDVAGRIVLKPFKNSKKLKGLEMGVSGYHRPVHGTTSAKKRLGYEARYEYQKFSIKGEYMSGQGTASSSSTTENRTLANGWYGQVGYYILPKLQGVLKVEGYDPNEQTANDKMTEFTIGLNYFIEKYNAKLQFNYIHKDEEAEDSLQNDQIISAVQVAF